MHVGDLIMQLRRVARSKRPARATLLRLAAAPALGGSKAARLYWRNALEEVAARTGARLFLLESGDACLIEETQDGTVADDLTSLLESEAPGVAGGAAGERLIESFPLPEFYMPLRERLERLQQNQAAVSAEAGGAPAGPLTPERLGAMLEAIDAPVVERFLVKETLMRRDRGWQPVHAAWRVDGAGLLADRFPKVAVEPASPLGDELHRHMDRLVLQRLLRERPYEEEAVAVRLRHGAEAAPELRRLAGRLESHPPGRVLLEIPWIDYLRDLESGAGALEGLRRSGFALILDGVGIALLPHLGLELAAVDRVKLVFERARLPLLMQKPHLAALRALGPERVILAGCDDASALELGGELGIRHFQGPAISEAAAPSLAGAA